MQQTVVNLSNTLNNNTIFYDMVGNFIPPEWKNLTSSSGKILSKTARQILSLIVSRVKSDRFFAQEGIANQRQIIINFC